MVRTLVIAAIVLCTAIARGDIYRWDTGELIPGTAGIEPGPGASLASLELAYADLRNFDLSGADLKATNLAYAKLTGSTLTNADLSGADTRGAELPDLGGAVTQNLILPDGRIRALHLEGATSLRIPDHDGDATRQLPPIGIHVTDSFYVWHGSRFVLTFDADPWDSTITFQPGIAGRFQGGLFLEFADGVNILEQVGRSFRIVDWTGVEAGSLNSTINSNYNWDDSRFSTTGEITLLLPGDSNLDRVVDLNDLNDVRNHFGESLDPGVTDRGDTNGDLFIDLYDLNNVRNYFGATSAHPVAEPNSLGLLGVSALGLLLLHRVRASKHSAKY